MAECVIEQVTDFDAAWPELEALILDVVKYHRPWDQRVLRPDWSARMREYMTADGITFVARDAAGEAMGFIAGGISRDVGIFEEVAGHIDNAFVDERFRKAGVGGALLGRFETWCKEQGASEVVLEVTHGNDLGLAFWTKSGYEPRMQLMARQLEVST